MLLGYHDNGVLHHDSPPRDRRDEAARKRPTIIAHRRNAVTFGRNRDAGAPATGDGSRLGIV
jgi:hypothetical protein